MDLKIGDRVKIRGGSGADTARGTVIGFDGEAPVVRFDAGMGSEPYGMACGNIPFDRIDSPAPEVLGTDRNGEPVRVGDYLAINDYVAEVTRRGLVYVMENSGLLGETDSQPLRVWLRWHTRARARELGFPAHEGDLPEHLKRPPCGACARRGHRHPRCVECGSWGDVSPIASAPTIPAPSGGSVGAATREAAGAAPSGSESALPTQPSEGCQDPCYICGQSDPIVARLENEPICEHCYTHCHECNATLIAGRDATVLTERLCDYCDRRAAYVLAGREPRVDLPVPAESYEDGDVYELPNAEWP